jgi:hypothetical protein
VEPSLLRSRHLSLLSSGLCGLGVLLSSLLSGLLGRLVLLLLSLSILLRGLLFLLLGLLSLLLSSLVFLLLSLSILFSSLLFLLLGLLSILLGLLVLLLLVLVAGGIKSLLLLRGNLLVELDVGRVVVGLLEILDGALPDGSEGGSGVLGDGGPGGLSTEELHALGLGGEGLVEGSGGTGNAAKLADVLESVVAEDVLRDELALVKDHDGLRLRSATVGDDNVLREDVLLELVAATVVDGDLDLLHNEHDSGDLIELVLEVGFAEDVVELVVEAVVDLVDYEHLIDLLHDLALEAVVDDLKALLLNLNYLLLLVEVLEAISEVEALAVEAVDYSSVETLAENVVGALGDRRGDGASSSEAGRKGNSGERLDRHFEMFGLIGCPVNTEGVN